MLRDLFYFSLKMHLSPSGCGFTQRTLSHCLFFSAALGEFMHPCEDDIVCKCTTEENKVPYFNAPVYLENKEQIGKVDEIFGQLRDFVSFSVMISAEHFDISICYTEY